MSEELKPCPFCSSTPKVLEVEGMRGGGGFLLSIVCSEPLCRAHGPLMPTPESAAEAWNARPEYKNEAPNKLKLVWSTDGQGLHHDFELASPPTVFDKTVVVHVTEETANEMLNAAREVKDAENDHQPRRHRA